MSFNNNNQVEFDESNNTITLKQNTFDNSNAEVILKNILAICKMHKKDINIDLSSVTKFDSAAVATLIEIVKTQKEVDKNIILTNQIKAFSDFATFLKVDKVLFD